MVSAMRKLPADLFQHNVHVCGSAFVDPCHLRSLLNAIHLPIYWGEPQAAPLDLLAKSVGVLLYAIARKPILTTRSFIQFYLRANAFVEGQQTFVFGLCETHLNTDPFTPLYSTWARPRVYTFQMSAIGHRNPRHPPLHRLPRRHFKGMNDPRRARSNQCGTLRSRSSSQAVALPSEGARQSPRGDNEPPADTFGPFGMAERLNWLKAKNRRKKTSSHFRISVNE